MNRKRSYFLDYRNIRGNNLKIMVFDTETNGLDGSILSFSGVIAEMDLENNKCTIVEEFDRFYYPLEKFDMKAMKVHHISLNTIRNKQREANHSYPMFFRDDIEYFFQLAKKVDILCAHNMAYDLGVLQIADPEKFFTLFDQHGLPKKKLDTMKVNESVLKLPGKYGYKWPTLTETLEFYREYLCKPIEEIQFHNSLEDCKATLMVVDAMLKSPYRDVVIKYIGF